MKFPLTVEQAAAVEKLLSPRMTLDPHANVQLGDAYCIASLYTDSPEFDAYHRRGKLRSTKFRVRSYGSNGPLFVEQKTKRRNLVRKQRVFIDPADLDRLTVPSTAANWAGNWCQQQVARHQLRPVCQVSYLRKAYFAGSETGPLRLTFDSGLRGQAVSSWRLCDPDNGERFASDLVICEFKFTAAMPTLFRSVIEELQLVPGSFSKYRQCVDLLELCPAREVRRA